MVAHPPSDLGVLSRLRVFRVYFAGVGQFARGRDGNAVSAVPFCSARVLISTLQQSPVIRVLSTAMLPASIWVAAVIIANMGSRHHPLQGFAPPIFLDSAHSLHEVAVAT